MDNIRSEYRVFIHCLSLTAQLLYRWLCFIQLFVHFRSFHGNEHSPGLDIRETQFCKDIEPGNSP